MLDWTTGRGALVIALPRGAPNLLAMAMGVSSKPNVLAFESTSWRLSCALFRCRLELKCLTAPGARGVGSLRLEDFKRVVVIVNASQPLAANVLGTSRSELAGLRPQGAIVGL
ncbi:hypothetical protein HCDSEM_146 [Candidatus Hodgkinia cicadicola Dsem]|nr:hypothetical protein HCDSEM_146 [Candidatus Hodgkinia cicadicola Dsem]